MKYGCENKVVGNRLCSGEELGGQPVFDCVGNVWEYVSSCAVGRGVKYLDDYHIKKGFMISFNFNKRKQSGVREIIVGDKVLVEAVV